MADSPDLPPISPDPAGPGAGPAQAVSGPVTPSPAPQPQSGAGLGAGLHALWTLLVRLIILGAGVSLGWWVGLLVAQVWPASNPEPPLTEVALRHGSQTRRKLRQLPRWWQDGSSGGLPSADNGNPTASSEPSIAEAPETAAPEPPLTEAERDDLQADLTRLQQDIASVTARLTELEAPLGAAPNGTVEERLQQLSQRLSPDPAIANAPETSTPETSTPETAPAAPPPGRVPYPEPRFALVSDRIVLPSALLFEPGSSTLTAPGQQLLDSIAPDLARYGAATLLVGSHSDGTANSDQASQLTLQQAVAVEQYLAPQLEGSGQRWVSVGYGQTRPSTGGTNPGDQQRNQRVEIGIVPRE